MVRESSTTRREGGSDALMGSSFAGRLVFLVCALAASVYSSTNNTFIQVMKDGQDITSKTSVCQDNQCYIRRQNIYADKYFSITLNPNIPVDSSFSVVIENLLLQVAPNTEGRFEISLGSVGLKIDRSTIKCNIIQIESSEINFDLVAIEYNNMNINANTSLYISKSETYNNRENCAQNTTKFAIDELFKDPQSLAKCSGFSPYGQIAGRLFAMATADRQIAGVFDLNVCFYS